MNDLLHLDRFPLFVIAGPCVIESAELCLSIGTRVKQICDKLGLAYIFKASFDKANRSSNSSFRGPGLHDGLTVLEKVKRELGVPVLTDIHEPDQAPVAAKVVDVLQVPAFLARQTDLVISCGKTGKAVNIKKGQFMSPQEMGTALDKVRSAGNNRAMLTERGTFFGYNRLVNDFTALQLMKSFKVPVIFDITHSTQQPAGLGTQSGGNPEYSPLLARAAVAAGVDGLFLECHPDPKNAKSDAATMMNINDVEPLLSQCKQIAELRARLEIGTLMPEDELPDESDMDQSDEPGEMACPYCGKMIHEDSEWCHHCGKYLSAEDSPALVPKWVLIGTVLALLGILSGAIAWLLK